MEDKIDEIGCVDSYKSIDRVSYGLYRELGSRFISIAYPVSLEEEAREILGEVKKEYHDARHHCYAYRIGLTGDRWRLNDDGEPSSSAGRPIMGQILSNELSDILIVVIRYFGGTKLGIPGLIKAYKMAAADAIQNGRIVSKVASISLTVTFEYLILNNIMKLIKETKSDILSQVLDNQCYLRVAVRMGEADSFVGRVENIGGVIL